MIRFVTKYLERNVLMWVTTFLQGYKFGVYFIYNIKKNYYFKVSIFLFLN